MAVLLDVTLIRMVLVPAVMSVLDARAWWLPAWLDRFLPHIDLDPTVSDQEPPRAHELVVTGHAPGIEGHVMSATSCR